MSLRPVQFCAPSPSHHPARRRTGGVTKIAVRQQQLLAAVLHYCFLVWDVFSCTKRTHHGQPDSVPRLGNLCFQVSKVPLHTPSRLYAYTL